MGGHVTVAVRSEDGSVYRNTRYTNALPCFAHHMGFINGDPDHIRDYIERDSAYASDDSDPLYPQGYGLVVFDMASKVILTKQGYCGFGETSLSGIGMSIPNGFVIYSDPEYPYQEEARLKALFDDGRMSWMEIPPEFEERFGGNPPWPDTWDELKALALDREVFRIGRIVIDLHPFVVERFDECDSDSTRAMRARLIELGFSLSEEEQRQWDAVIEEEEEWEDE